MGVNLVPKVGTIRIRPFNFLRTVHNEFVEHSFEDGCIEEEGLHRLLLFSFRCHNIGDCDLVAGNPTTQPDIFTPSGGHGHYHLTDFNKYILRNDSTGEEVASKKQAFCLEDTLPLSWPEEEWGNLRPKFTDCNTFQGISAGWADEYPIGLSCQFIVLSTPSGSVNVKDGTYTLELITNPVQPEGTLARFDGHIFKETNYDDNILMLKLEIIGNGVTVKPIIL